MMEYKFKANGKDVILKGMANEGPQVVFQENGDLLEEPSCLDC